MDLRKIILKQKKKNKTRRKKKKKKSIIKKNKKKETVKECLKKHMLVYITFIGCFYVLSKRFNKNIFTLLATLIFASFTGYLVHLISHLIYYREVYNKTDNILNKLRILATHIKSITEISNKYLVCLLSI